MTLYATPKNEEICAEYGLTENKEYIVIEHDFSSAMFGQIVIVNDNAHIIHGLSIRFLFRVEK